MFLGAMIMLLLFVGIIRRYKSQVPKGVAKFVEPLVVFVRDDIALQNIGEKHYKRFTPYLLTVFFFIWINNVLGLIPGGANLTGNISFTLTLSSNLCYCKYQRQQRLLETHLLDARSSLSR